MNRDDARNAAAESDLSIWHVEAKAWKRLRVRDPEDWPVLASALALGCPIWTEDLQGDRQNNLS
jgi:hypothetical protein